MVPLPGPFSAHRPLRTGKAPRRVNAPGVCRAERPSTGPAWPGRLSAYA